MKMMLSKMMLSISIMTIMLKTPMSMAITLLIQTMMLIMMMNWTNKSPWIPMITFLVMIGGLLTIFMYMSSITSNEKFKMNTKLMAIIMVLVIPTEEMMNTVQNNETQMIEKLMMDMSMTKMYNKSMWMTMMLIIYLLITMIAINKIINMFSGPLRSNTYE